MIYLVTLSQELFNRDEYKIISVKESLDLLEPFKVLQYDSETSGRDAHLCSLLSMQFGTPDGKNQVVVDCSTINPILYKELLEKKMLICQNAKTKTLPLE